MHELEHQSLHAQARSGIGKRSYDSEATGNIKQPIRATADAHRQDGRRTAKMLNANQELARNIAHLQEVYNSDCAFCGRYGDCHPCPDPDLLQKRADEWAYEYFLTDIVPLLFNLFWSNINA
jgi:hypothetical protein